MITFEILYAISCIVFAWLNAGIIVSGKKIYHGLNGAAHIAVTVIACWLYGWHGIVCLFIARVFFDWSLNLFRGLPLGYVSTSPKSIIDKIEKAIFRLDGVTPKIIYLVVIIVLNII